MVFDPTAWLLVPVGVLIAVAYTSTGISGANFWIPVYILWLGLDPRAAFWLALVTMLFGSASGLLRHWRQATIDWRAAAGWLVVSVPAAVAGSLAAPFVSMPLLASGFGLFAIVYGTSLVRSRTAEGAAGRDRPDRIARFWPLAGGLLTGLISVGLGALLLPRVLASPRLGHHARAVGTSLVAVFVTSLAAALARLRGEFVDQLAASLPELLGVMVFVVPAVLLGGQIGPLVARRLPRAMMFAFGGALLVGIGLLMWARVWLGR